MIAQLLYPARRAVQRTARRAAFGTAAGLLICVGAGFLTLAAWIALSQSLGALYAALVLGLVFIGLGLIVLAIGLRPSHRRHRSMPPGAPRSGTLDTVALINAFLGGLAAGQGMKRK